MERQLIVKYRQLLAEILSGLTSGNYDTAVKLASLPEQIRGYGPVKEQAVNKVREEKAALLATFQSADSVVKFVGSH